MGKYFLLIAGTSLIVVGAVLKITHNLDTWNDWIFRSGFVIGLVYLLIRYIKLHD